jgi:DNA-binding transcriptional regulator YiaG
MIVKDGMTNIEFREWRAAMGLTQSRAGELLGVTARAVRMWESGNRRVSQTVVILCAMLIREAGHTPPR